MSLKSCDCNVCIVEGIFGEVFTDVDKNDGMESTLVSSTGAGDYHMKSEVEPIKIKSFTMSNKNRMEVVLITLGATIVSIKCPDKFGDIADVVLGFDDLDSYLDPTLNKFMGCILGRCANRIKDGTFKIKDREYFLTKNDCKHHIHGGTNGFGRRIWESYIEEDCCVVMTYLSEDGEEGYPGILLTTLKFTLTHDNRLEIKMRATTSKPTVVNLSYGSFFNLAGHDAGEEELKLHKISFNCDRWTFTPYNNPIPTGAIRGVGGTVMDFRIPRFLKDAMAKISTDDGFDHNLCVIKSSQPELSLVSRAFHPQTGRFLEVYSDQPAVQFCTGGSLPPYHLAEDTCGGSLSSNYEGKETLYECSEDCDCETGTTKSKASVKKVLEFLPGKASARYKKLGAFSVQPQNYPNAVNIPHFPCAILRPGQIYYHDLIYKFGIQLSGYM